MKAFDHDDEAQWPEFLRRPRRRMLGMASVERRTWLVAAAWLGYATVLCGCAGVLFWISPEIAMMVFWALALAGLLTLCVTIACDTVATMLHPPPIPAPTVARRFRFTIRSLTLLVALIALVLAVLPFWMALAVSAGIVFLYVFWPMTLIEILVVTAIVGILIALLIPSDTTNHPPRRLRPLAPIAPATPITAPAPAPTDGAAEPTGD